MDTFRFFAVLLLCSVGAYCQECDGRPPMQQDDCCKITLPPPQAECLQRLREQWKAVQRFANKENSPQPSELMCAFNCFPNNTNIFTPDNKLNPDETKLLLEKFLGTEWQAVLPSIIDDCKKRLDNSNSNEPKPMANCDVGKEKIFFCLREQFTTKCPDSLWRNSAECNDVRSYLKNCPFEKRVMSRQA